MGSFVQRGVPDLQRMVGDGLLRGIVTDDQVYAKYQHERMDLKHPHGGKAKYLQDPLNQEYRQYYQRMADRLLQGGLVDAMQDAVESLAGSASQQTPVLFNNLRRSLARRVLDGGSVAHYRPPEQPRLSRAQLNQIRRGRGRGRR